MKKRILSLIILAFCLVSVFAFVSCGKNDEKIACPHEKCDGELLEMDSQDGRYYCNKQGHLYKDCVNEDCDEKLEYYCVSEDIENGKTYEIMADYCPSCGTSQKTCSECADNNVDGLYCTSCGRQVPKDSSIRDILGKHWNEREKAISNSALIMCFGMLGIFIVTAVIITFVLLLNTIVEKVRQSKENKQ